MGGRRVVAATAVGAATLTVLVVLLPQAPYGVRSPALHAATDTAATCVGLLAAALAASRFRRHRRASDLALAIAFLLFGATNLAFSVTPTVLGHPKPLATWGAATMRLVGAVAFCLAALLPPRPVTGAVGGRWAAASLGLLGAAGVGVASLGDRLPEVVTQAPGTPEAGLTLVAHPVLAAFQAVGLCLYGAAAVGLWRRAGSGDELSAWLSAAATLAALARPHYMLFPSLYADMVSSGDLLRVGFYALVLTGVARELARDWRQAATVAVLEERRRMARDLHDGLAQELAFVTSAARSLTGPSADDARAARIVAGAERALDESRRAIAALTRPIDEPLDLAVGQAAQDVAVRLGARARLDLAADVHVPPSAREDLLRIVREAVTNSVRHGHADEVEVSLSRERQALRLKVIDHGAGFDPEAPSSPASFGLVSMRERAERLGGALRIVSRPGAGTRVEVVVPR